MRLGELDKYKVLLILLFLFVFISKLFFAFQTEHFTYDSYYTLRHIEAINQNFVPLYNDPLSYEGRKYYFPPLFHYIMALLSSIMGLTIAAKVLPTLFFSTLVLLVYATAFNVTRHKLNSFLAALFFALSPITYVFPINVVSSYSLAIPLFFAVLYCMTKPYTYYNLNRMLLLIVALVFTHPSAFILVIGLIFYLVLLKTEGMEVDKKKTEVVLFTMLLVFWALFVLYKNAFLTHGLSAVWQNVPSAMLSKAFHSFSILEIVYFVGLVPLYFGISGAYSAAFREKEKSLLLLLGFTLAIFLLLWLNFVRLNTGLLYLSVLMSILSAQGLIAWSQSIGKTKLHKWQWVRTTFIVIFFLISSAIPLYASAMKQAGDTPGDPQIEALQWLEKNTPRNSIVLASLKEGHLVTYFAKRKNVIDSNFMLIKDIEQRFLDTKRIFTLRLKSGVFKVLTRYDVDYIFFSDVAKDQYNVEHLTYTRDRKCFTKPYDEGIQIYQWHCRVEDS